MVAKVKHMYYWKNDLIDLTKEEFVYWLDDVVARNYEKLEDNEELDFIYLFAIAKNTKLHYYLRKWHKGNEKEVIRCYMEDTNFIYFVSGCNYAIFDNDLLGGNADGTTEKKFNIFVDDLEDKNGGATINGCKGGKNEN